MTIPPSDRDVLRTLVEQKARIASLPIQAQNDAMWVRLNRLEPVKPLIWINEICWQEFEGDPALALECSEPACRVLESQLRRELYQWEHFPGDMVVEDVVYCPIAIHDSGFGIGEESRKVYAYEGAVASREFVPTIREPADIEKIKRPDLSVDWDATNADFGAMQAAFGDIIRIENRGVPGRWFAPWDELVRWWGVEDALMDLLLRPEMVHEAMDRLLDAYTARLDQWESLGVLSMNNTPIRIGSGGYGCTDELPGEDFDPDHVRARDIWGCATAQIFGDVSPPMHDEFALQYERRWLDRYGLTYYGCCEPLHLKVDILRSVTNLRKISTSPWADVEKMAEATNGDYVLSFKPNPSHLAEDIYDVEASRAYLADKLTQARGCPVEVIQKDISTLRHEPGRLDQWAAMAAEVTAEFAP